MAELSQSNTTPTPKRNDGNLFIKRRYPETPKPSVENPTPVHPLFVLNKTLLPPNFTGYISQFDLLLACEMEAGEGQIDAIIRSGALWRIYPRNEDAKQTLLIYGITFMGFQVQLLESNPFSKDSTKLFVSGLPLCISNQEMVQCLRETGIKVIGDVEFELIVDEKNVSTTCKSGRRICKIEKPNTNLDKTMTICTFKCPIFYYGQIRNNRNQNVENKSDNQKIPQTPIADHSAEEHSKTVTNDTVRCEDILSNDENLSTQDNISNSTSNKKDQVNDKMNNDTELPGNIINSQNVNNAVISHKSDSKNVDNTETSPKIDINNGNSTETSPKSDNKIINKNMETSPKTDSHTPNNKEKYSAIAKGLFTKYASSGSPQKRGRPLNRQISLTEHLGKKLPKDGRKTNSPNRKRSVSKNTSLGLSPAKRSNIKKDNSLKEIMNNNSVQFATMPSRDGPHGITGV